MGTQRIEDNSTGRYIFTLRGKEIVHLAAPVCKLILVTNTRHRDFQHRAVLVFFLNSSTIAV